MNGIIYKHIGPDGMVYVGQTTTAPKLRWRNGEGYLPQNHKQLSTFAKYIMRVGWDNIRHEIIENNIQTKQELDERESYWIDYYKELGLSLNTYKRSDSGNHPTEEELHQIRSSAAHVRWDKYKKPIEITINIK